MESRPGPGTSDVARPTFPDRVVPPSGSCAGGLRTRDDGRLPEPEQVTAPAGFSGVCRSVGFAEGRTDDGFALLDADLRTSRDSCDARIRTTLESFTRLGELRDILRQSRDSTTNQRPVKSGRKAGSSRRKPAL